MVIQRASKAGVPTARLTADEFIDGAPDGGGAKPTAQVEDVDAPRRVKKGKKVQITHTLMETALNDLDALAARAGQSRAGIINLGIAYMLEHGISLGRK